MQALSGLGLTLGRSVLLGHHGHTHQPVLEGGLPLTKLGCAWPSAVCSKGCAQGLGLYLWWGGQGSHSYCPEVGVGSQQPECSWHPVPSTPALALLLRGPLLWFGGVCRLSWASSGTCLWTMCLLAPGNDTEKGPPSNATDDSVWPLEGLRVAQTELDRPTGTRVGQPRL